jgi:hypothetical protein
MKSGKLAVAMFVMPVHLSACHSGRDAPEPPAGPANVPTSAPTAAPSAAPAPHPTSAGPALLAPNVAAVVHAQIEPEATRCFEKGLKAAPSQAGSVVLVIKVEPSGKVASVSAGADGALSVDTVDCIQWVAKRTEFDPPGDDAGTVLRVPLTFPH